MSRFKLPSNFALRRFKVAVVGALDPAMAVAVNKMPLAKIQATCMKADQAMSLDSYEAIISICTASPRSIESYVRDSSIDPTKLALHARALDIPFLLVTSPWVFGSAAIRHSVTETPAPLSQMGVAQWWGERSVRAVNPDAVIVRAGMVHGVGVDVLQPGGMPSPWSAMQEKVMRTQGMRTPALIDLVASITLDLDFNDLLASILYGVTFSDSAGKTFHIGPPDPITMFDFMVEGKLLPRALTAGVWSRVGDIQAPASLFLEPTHVANGPEAQWEYLRKPSDG